MIELKNVNFSYGKKNIIDNISIIIPDKGFLLIKGKSGTGKTTLLNILSGGLKPNGLVLYNGNNIYLNSKSAEEYRRSNVTFVNQNNDLFKELSVKENLEIALEINKKNIDEKEIKEKLEFFGLGCKLNNKVSTLSGGEKRRLSFIRTLLIANDVLVADEITSQLDKENQMLILETLKEISKTKLIILVSHDEIASSYCDIIYNADDSTFEKNNDIQGKQEVTVSALSSLSLSNRLKLSKLLIHREKWLLFFFYFFYLITSLLIFAFVEIASYDFHSYYQKQLIDNNYKTICLENNSRDSMGMLDKLPCLYGYHTNYEYENIVDQITNPCCYDYSLELLNEIGYQILVGSYPERSDEVIISSSLADKMSDNYSLLIGNNINLLLEKDYTFTIVGIYGDNSVKNCLDIRYSIMGIEMSKLQYKSTESAILLTKDYVLYKNAVKNDFDKLIPKTDYFADYIKIDDTLYNFRKLSLALVGTFAVITCLITVLYGRFSCLALKNEFSLLLYLGSSKNDCKKIFITQIIFSTFIVTVISLFLVMLVNRFLDMGIIANCNLEFVTKIVKYQYSNILVGFLLFVSTNSVLYLCISILIKRNISDISKL